MKATPFEFRHRFWLFLIIYVLGFVAPWNFAVRVDQGGPNAHVWGLLAALAAKSGAISIGAAFNGVLVAGIGSAFAGAFLRTWGSAYLGTGVMRDSRMHDAMVADGPYRRTRNPLYVGSWIHMLALALLMPPSGAIVSLLLAGLLELRLIFAEEAFLAAQLGEPYRAYCAKVPRLLPALRPQVPASGARPRWGQAVLAEIFLWGVAASFAVLGWKYNAVLLDQCVLVSLGAALIVRAFATREPAAV